MTRGKKIFWIYCDIFDSPTPIWAVGIAQPVDIIKMIIIIIIIINVKM